MKIIYPGTPYLNLNLADARGTHDYWTDPFARQVLRHSHIVVNRTKAIFGHIDPKLKK